MVNAVLIIMMFVQNEIRNEFNIVFSKRNYAEYCFKFSALHNMRVNKYAFVLILLSYFEVGIHLYELKHHIVTFNSISEDEPDEIIAPPQ